QVANAFGRTAGPEQKQALEKLLAHNKSPLAEVIAKSIETGGPIVKKETPDDLRSSHQIIRLSVTPGQMKYDQPEITAKPGKPIALVFNNPDVLQHNVVKTKPGPLEKTGPPPK